MQSKPHDDLRGEIDRAVQRYEQVETDLCEATNTVSAGDLFLFDMPMNIPLEWAVIFRHPDDAALWFVVPADQNPMVGVEDVELAESAKCGPLILRCGRGLWVHAGEFDFQMRSGRLEPEYVDQARDKLSQIVAGSIAPLRFQSETESDLDYDYWLSEVTQAVDWLERKLQSEPALNSVVLRAADFSNQWYRGLHSHGSDKTPTVLAAAAGGLQAVPEMLEEPPAGLILFSDLPGELVALKYVNGIVIQYIPLGREEPPQLYRGGFEEHRTLVPWKHAPDGSFVCDELLRWEGTSITFDVGSSAGRKVTIEQ